MDFRKRQEAVAVAAVIDKGRLQPNQFVMVDEKAQSLDEAFPKPSAEALLHTVLAQHGAVSEAVACAMAEGATRHSAAQVSLAVTGVAGPGGGSPDKPVGTVWFAWVVNGQTSSERLRLDGDRAAVRAATVQHALQGLLARLA